MYLRNLRGAACRCQRTVTAKAFATLQLAKAFLLSQPRGLLLCLHVNSWKTDNIGRAEGSQTKMMSKNSQRALSWVFVSCNSPLKEWVIAPSCLRMRNIATWTSDGLTER